MKIIQNEFTRWGGIWKLVERTDNVALLLQEGRNWNVAIIQHSEPREIAGRMTEGGENLPSETQYGKTAWNYGTNEEKARAKFQELINLK